MKVVCESLSTGYPRGPDVLRNVSCSFAAGRVTGLLGPNGCGKSTLLRCINGSLRARAGRVRLDERDVATIDPLAAARLVAVIAQEAPFAAPFTAIETVLLGLHPHATARADSTGDIEFARECLRRVDALHLAARPFHQLSGGERQRVAFARALAQQTPLLLLDEATAHLDLAHQLGIYRLARELAREGRTVAIVCHDLLLAPLFLDDCVLMTAGQVVAAGGVAATLTPDRVESIFGPGCAIRWTGADAVEARLVPGAQSA